MRNAFYIALIIVMAVACAKKDNGADHLGQESFNEWIKTNAPTAEKLSEGVYIKFIERSTKPYSRPQLDTSWILTNYTASNLNGTIFVTRDKYIARLIGIFTENVHYCEDLVYYSANEPKFSKGLRMALKQMKQGDSAVVYLSSVEAYQESMPTSADYLNQSAAYTGFPCIFNIRVGLVTNDPRRYEMDTVASYARIHWKQEPKDTVYPGVYMKKTLSNPKGDTITKDSSVWVSYSQYFMDDFLYQTNNDSIAKKWKRLTDENMNSFVPFNISMESKAFPYVFTVALKHMRKGEEAEFLTISSWGQGNEAKYTGSPVIGFYTPTIYKVKILKAYTPK